MEKQRGQKGAEQNQQKPKRFTNVFPEKHFPSEGAEIKNTNRNFCKLSVKSVRISMLLQEAKSCGHGLGPCREPPAGGSTALGTDAAGTGERLPPQMFAGFVWGFGFACCFGGIFSPEKLLWCVEHRGKICSVPTEVLFLPQQRCQDFSHCSSCTS